MEPDDSCSRKGQKDGTSYSPHPRSDITLIEIETCKNWDAQENKTYTLEELDVFIKCAVSSLISFTLPGTSTSGEGIPAEGYSGLSLDWPTWHSLHFFSKKQDIPREEDFEPGECQEPGHTAGIMLPQRWILFNDNLKFRLMAPAVSLPTLDLSLRIGSDMKRSRTRTRR